MKASAISGKAPILGVSRNSSLDFSRIIPAPEKISYSFSNAIASSLILANLNCIPLDWAARLSVGGTDLSYFVVKQFPVLPPSAYFDKTLPASPHYIDLIIPRALGLVFTSYDAQPFAQELGSDTPPPFTWKEDRRLKLRCELDAIYALMYGLDRNDLDRVLDSTKPSTSFPTLKRHEIEEFGECRTKKLVLDAYEQFPT